MKNIFNIFKTHFYTISWTLCYILAMWAILAGLFGFDMFSGTAWINIMRARLHGFGGLVFGILILAAIPMYIATTTIIIRTKKPLFTIPVPGFVRRAFAPPPPPEITESETHETPPQKSEDTEPINLSPDIPTELRGAFIRARRGGSIHMTRSAFDMANSDHANIPTAIPQTPTTSAPATEDSGIPLPDDFDFMDDEDPSPIMVPSGDIPTFSEITFDDTPTAPAPDTPAPTVPVSTEQKHNTDDTNPDTDGEFVISNGMLIASHTDPDFWIADDTDWFASGKQRPSPVTAVKARATELGLTPVLYLAETNILDLDARIAAWESDGVRVVTDLADLDN